MKTSFSRFVPLLLAGSLSLVLAGCSDSGSSVKGQVKIDGAPIGAKAKVEFEPADPKSKLPAAVVWTKDDGTFEHAPPKGAFALKPGKYNVFISRIVDKDGNVPSEDDPRYMEGSGASLKNQVAARFSDRSKPEITVDIKDGTNELPPFEVRSK